VAVNRSDAWDVDAWLSADELTMYFASNRDNNDSANLDLYVVTRQNRGVSFSLNAVTNLNLLGASASSSPNTLGWEARPSLTLDGLTLYATTRTGTGRFHIAIAQRSRTNESFGPLTEAAVLNSTADDGDPYVLPTQEAMYFSSSRGGTSDMYRAQRVGDQYSAPELLRGPVNSSAAEESHPVVTPDELTLYFNSDRAGKPFSNIYVATRARKEDDFGEPTPLDSLNTPGYDSPNWISEDNCVLYFHSTRTETGAQYDLFSAIRRLDP
jgi:Tol biopolymer transport system component